MSPVGTAVSPVGTAAARRPGPLPCPGDVVLLDRAASVQFATAPIRFRVIGIDPRQTYHGWLWLVGYQLDQRGNAVARREVFVQIAGVRPVRVLPGG